jgi:hypothetical protein
MADAKKSAGRYQPGAYTPPEPKEIEVEGLGTFLVQPLSTKAQEDVEAEVVKERGETDRDHSIRLGYAKMAAALLEPKMTPAQIQEDQAAWTPREGGEFVTKVQLAAHAIDEEDLEDVRSRFRPAEDE